MVCALCEKSSEFWFGSLCGKCRKIKHLMSIHGDRVYEILNNVLSRAKDKQIIKEAEEIKEEIISKQYNLRNKNSKKDMNK
tara:strand:- start:8522 stop:8764 length:243 start_codon:yes stop_codon:yes gene_type:complete